MKHSLLLLGLVAGSFSASAQWVNQPVSYPAPSQFSLVLSAVDANAAWTTVVDVAQESSTLNYARTTNGGSTWTVAAVPGNAQTEFLTDLQALDANTAWAAVATDPDNLTGGRLLKTTNGGATWVTVTTSAQFSAGVPAYVRFFSATQGVAVGDGLQNRFEVYTSADAGASWTPVPAANIPPKLVNEELLELLPLAAKVGNALWLVTSRGRVFRTTDAGQTWSVSAAPVSANDFVNAIAFRDAANGLILLDTGELLRTTDGGLTWTRVQPTGSYHTIGLDAVPGTRTYVATGFAGTGTGGLGTGAGSSYSTDDGLTWTALESTLNHALVDFTGPGAGWSAGVQLDASGELSGGTGMYRYNGMALASARPKTLALQVAPNPSADGRFRVQVPAGPAAQLRVRDALGRLVLEQSAAAGAPATLDLSRCRAGLYTLELRAGEALGQQKLVVQ